MSAIHILGFVDVGEFELGLDSMRIFSVIMQVLNFIVMAQMIVFGPRTHADMRPEEVSFDLWLFIEFMLIFGTILSNLTFLFIRSIERNKLAVDVGTNEDVYADYLSSFEVQFIVNIFSIAMVPSMILAGTQYVYLPHREAELSQEEQDATRFQAGCLLIQAWWAL